jgi:hypothetical protein
MAILTPIKVRGRELKPPKASVSPLLGARNVLTKEPWTFVSLWLRRQKNHDALFYWEQADEFYRASAGLPLRSAPLLLYYCYMNAAKALLVAKRVAFNPYHGVALYDMGGQSRKISIANEGVRIKNEGVLPALSGYFGESEPLRTHSLRDLFFNMPFIHRTFCLTYRSQQDMFLPLTDCKYATERRGHEAFFVADLSKDWASKHFMNRLPPPLKAAPELGPRTVRSVQSVPISRPRRPTPADLGHLAGLHRSLRQGVYYINGTETLWYVKMRTRGPRTLARQTPTLVLAAMHRLSELCRYHPLRLEALLAGQQNWLISEFLQMSPSQFIDEIASEITGHQFLTPNVRAAT